MLVGVGAVFDEARGDLDAVLQGIMQLVYSRLQSRRLEAFPRLTSGAFAICSESMSLEAAAAARRSYGHCYVPVSLMASMFLYVNACKISV